MTTLLLFIAVFPHSLYLFGNIIQAGSISGIASEFFEKRSDFTGLILFLDFDQAQAVKILKKRFDFRVEDVDAYAFHDLSVDSKIEKKWQL